jgi:hypothetical protein
MEGAASVAPTFNRRFEMSEPKRGNSSPNITNTFSPNALPDPEMIDVDNVMGFEGMKANGCLTEGCSGSKPIDTLYENTSCDYVDNPREGSTPAPICLTGPMYPHRDL